MVTEIVPKQVMEIVKYDFPEDITGEQSNALFELLLNRIDSVITGNGFNRDVRKVVVDNYTIPQCYFGMEERYLENEIATIDAMFDDVEDGKTYMATLSSLARVSKPYYEIAIITENKLFIKLWD